MAERSADDKRRLRATPSASDRSTRLPFLAGGDMGARMRVHDWSTSPLGPPESWPQSLRSVVGLLLNSQFPMFVAWGDQLGYLYNDAHAKILGAKHPQALGSRLHDTWREVWADISPLIDTAMSGEAVYRENLPLVVNRRGFDEQAFFTFSYSPVRDESGAVAGIFCAVHETTGQVLAERRITDERDRQRRLFEQAPGFICTLEGPDHIFTFVNDAHKRLFGDRALGKSMREAFPDLAGQGFYELLDQVYATGQRHVSYAAPARFQAVQGAPATDRFLDFVYEPVRDETGRVTGIFCEGHDVTQAHLAQAALRESEARYRTLFETIDEGFCVIEFIDGPHGPLSDYVHIEANPAYVANAGIPDIVGKRLREIVGDEADAWVETYRRVLVTGVPVRFERELLATGRYLELAAFRVEPPERRQVAVLFKDVTERKRIEEERSRLVTVIEQSSDFFGIADPAGRGVYINHGARRMCGLPDDIDPRDVKIMDFFLPEDHDFVRDVVMPAQTSERGYQGELRFRRFDGGPPIPVSYYGFTIKNERGDINAFATVTRDITERVKAESLRSLHSRVLELAIEDRPLGQALEELVRAVEAASHAGVIGSILLLDADGRHLRHGAAPGLPADYNAAIDGIMIGPAIGSCGTAAYTKFPVYVSDIATDPLWANFRELALSHGLRACWSTPILSSQGSVLGTFAMYYSESREPAAADLELIDFVARSAALVIERKQAEAAVRDSELRYRTLFENIDSGFCVFDMLFDGEGRPVDYVFVEVNPAFEVHTGLRDAVGRRMSELVPGHEQRWYDLYGKVAQTGAPLRVEDFAWALGRWYEIYAYRVGDPEQHRVAALFSDVSERKRSDARIRELNETLEQRVAERTVEFHRFRDIVEATRSPICAFDTEYRLIAFNKAHNDEFRRVNGFDSKLGDVFPDLFIPEQGAIMRALMSRALSGERFTVTEEFGRPEFGHPLWEISYTPLRDEDGAIIGAFHLATDISDRLRAEAELVLAQEQLRQSQKMEAMGSLTGGVAHDFNNLLTPIVGSLDLIQRKGLGGERERRLIDGALQSAERAKVLVQRLLAFARRQPLQPEAVDVKALIEGMANLVASTSGPTIRLEIDVVKDLPPALADANQIEMALLNLSVNARDAMPDGGRLTIAATVDKVEGVHRAGLAPGRYVRLSVADSGVGMDETTLSRAVEPFFSTKGIGKGTGLGLSMVHGLAAQLGGGLAISSKPGLGTQVDLWLPVSAEAVKPSSQLESTTSTPRSGTALLVDDEDLVRLSTADMLVDLGYSVVQARSTEEAMRHLGDGLVPDLVVTDHLMPGMSGTELVRRLRADRPSLPALIVSGYADIEGVAPDLPRLVKPFRQADLAAAIAELSSL